MLLNPWQVPLPMKFTGVEHVELRLPRTLDDLRAYMSMSLLLQRFEPPVRGDGRRRRRQSTKDDGNLFILYLGNKDVSKIFIALMLFFLKAEIVKRKPALEILLTVTKSITQISFSPSWNFLVWKVILKHLIPQATKDYIGMFLKNNVLHFVYKLNGKVTEIKSTDITLSREDRIFFDKVDVQRLGQDTFPSLFSHYWDK